ncbi:GIY-YIG nuclease family protein [Azospirillum brasilense]|uniref:GIY-YIG nuclease family protein n=1 Tax=Azospirillum brasilense TaxID=192 RepID=A0A6L3ATA4_AZOBR|nr:GIY-YIG nuclease family protein [Azospirillum brasilense]KAA0678203.1 GIY-YIG nuclease family protein [Azospirillum brasilense]
MNLTYLLTAEAIDPEQTIVLRHRPKEPALAKVLPWLAEERPDLFEVFQSAQGQQLEKAMSKARYIASFVAHGPGRALFVGMYELTGSTSIPMQTFWDWPGNAELRAFGMQGPSEDDPRTEILMFQQQHLDSYAHWKGKLIIDWPPPERSWWRRAHQNEMPVHAILEDSALERGMPHWTELVLSWDELNVLPRRWRETLSQWRGIYFIRDRSDGKAYVGSAAGADNLFGRWKNYAETGHGGNKLLRKRDPQNFVFSVLQRTSPDMTIEEIVQLEAGWKVRLGTHALDGLNDN